MLAKLEHTVQVENFEVFLILAEKIIHVEGGINTCTKFSTRTVRTICNLIVCCALPEQAITH